MLRLIEINIYAVYCIPSLGVLVLRLNAFLMHICSFFAGSIKYGRN